MTDRQFCETHPWFTGARRCSTDNGFAHFCYNPTGHRGPCLCDCGSVKDQQQDAEFCGECGETVWPGRSCSKCKEIQR